MDEHKRTKREPPKAALALLRWVCADKWVNEIEGDLQEAFTDRLNEKGAFFAHFFYWKEVLLFLFRPHIYKQAKRKLTPKSFAMWPIYLKVAYRNFLRNKAYSVINIFGLAFGLASFLLIALYVYDELHYDQFFEDSENIYRITANRKTPESLQEFAVTSVVLAPKLLEDIPEVESTCRIHKLFFHPEIMVRVNQQTFVETQMILADGHLFDVFSLNFLEGEAKTALDSREKIILTASTAKKYFGEKSAMNQVLHLDFNRKLVVAGVVEDLPPQSHLAFDLIGHLEFMSYIRDAIKEPKWTQFFVHTYAKVRQDFKQEAFEVKLTQLLQQYAKEEVANTWGVNHELQLRSQPLLDIHLHSSLFAEIKPNGNKLNIQILTLIAILVLLVSCVNFINLSTARSTERAKEVGVRKVLGSQKVDLFQQFLLEAIFISFLGLVLAMALLKVALPFYNILVGKSFQFAIFFSFKIIIGLLVLGLIIGLFSGVYPAIVIAKMKPSLILKGQFRSGLKSVRLRNALVVFQYFISITLLAGTIIVNQQIEFIQRKQLGFDQENILLIKHPLSLGENVNNLNSKETSIEVVRKANQQIKLLKEELKSLNQVINVGGSFSIPGKHFGFNLFEPEDATKKGLQAHTQAVDKDFIETMGIEVLAGRSFSAEYNDTFSLIINEAAALKFAWENPIGKRLKVNLNGNPSLYKIVGLVKNYHFQSLHNKVEPIIINYGTSDTYFPTALAVKIKTDHPDEAIREIEKKWEKLAAGQTMVWSFLDKDLNQLYQSEKTSNYLFRSFTFLAILLASIGLFSLATYMTHQRTKEIGIRKVLGASIADILLLLGKDFTRLIAFAFILAVPISYISMSRWLEHFAYRIDIEIITFLAVGGFTLLLAGLTIGYQSIKAALLNPVKSLRNE